MKKSVLDGMEISKLERKIMDVVEWNKENKRAILDEIWLPENEARRRIYFALLYAFGFYYALPKKCAFNDRWMFNANII